MVDEDFIGDQHFKARCGSSPAEILVFEITDPESFIQKTYRIEDFPVDEHAESGQKIHLAELAGSFVFEQFHEFIKLLNRLIAGFRDLLVAGRIIGTGTDHTDCGIGKKSHEHPGEPVFCHYCIIVQEKDVRTVSDGNALIAGGGITFISAVLDQSDIVQ